MSADFISIFRRLRANLQKHSGTLSVQEDSPGCYSLAGTPGPATLKSWGGKLKKPLIRVAWVKIEKAYVSYHLMGVHGNPKLSLSKELKARMQGKTCFNFKTADETLFAELDHLTAQTSPDCAPPASSRCFSCA